MPHSSGVSGAEPLSYPCFTVIAALLLLPHPSPAAPIEQIEVFATSPLLGGGIDARDVPAETTVIDTATIARNGAPNLLGALASTVAGVNLDSASGNPFQPSLFYHGFQASPLQGTGQGLAVYVDGVRFNQVFGDTVDWELIPDIAIARVNVEGANPVFGLNALGGAINLRLKDGFSFTGAQAELEAGSFATGQSSFQYGANAHGNAIYLAAHALHQNGWRNLQISDIQNFYADLAHRTDLSEIHLQLTLANSFLNGPGPAPVQLIAADPSAQFTAPNVVANRFAESSVSLNQALTDQISVQAVAYYRYLLQRIVNGNASNDQPCPDGSGLICGNSGQPVTTRGGAPIPAFLGARPYSQLNLQTTNANSYGASAQISADREWFGLPNHAAAGFSFDGAQTEFSATALIGGLSPITREYLGPGIVIDQFGNRPVRVAIGTNIYGLFASDSLHITRALTLTASARFNTDRTRLADQGGGDISGNHSYDRLNPAIGLAYAITPATTIYAGYAEANRAPTPAELSCASPQQSCSLANFFVGDPNLKQVVARTFEAGLRGNLPGIAGARLHYSAGLFSTESENDIAFVNSPSLGRAYFANVGQTRRQGLDAEISLVWPGFEARAAYSHVAATYRTGFIEAAGSNPAADAGGNLTIRPGSTLPGIPANRLKLSALWHATGRVTLGGDALWQSGQYLFGDEANLTPRLPGFATLNLNAAYRLTPRISIGGRIENVTDTAYYTYGTFSPTASVFLAQAPNAANPRSYTRAAPIAGFASVKLSF